MSNPSHRLQQGLEHHRAQQWPEAEACYRDVLRANPRHPDALHLLGVLAHQTGRHALAAESIAQAIGLQPNCAGFHNNHGEALRALGRLSEAEAAYRRALALEPGAIDPLVNLGGLLRHSGRLDEAHPILDEAVRLRPDHHGAWNNLGSVHRAAGAWTEAIHCYQRAIALRPDWGEARLNLANTWQDTGRFDAAIDALRGAVAVAPNLAEAHWNLALLLLRGGDWREGWCEFEWRWHPANYGSDRRHYRQPPWRGQDLQGKTILLHTEQGYGDTLQFIRYAPLLAARGARVLVGCTEPLRTLLQTVAGVDQVATREEELPPFDYHAPLLSLPGAFQTELDSIPATVPYLRPPPSSPRLPPPSSGRRIGLVWAGSRAHRRDERRSVAAREFTPIVRVGSAHFYALQTGPAAAQVAELAAVGRVEDLSAALVDFSATAGLIDQLDLVITVDTAVAHLAGALGKPVWVLLYYDCDWRWLWHRADSPWYPTMRLFRQGSDGEWAPVIMEVARALADERPASRTHSP